MQDKKMHKLGKTELLTIIYDQQKEIEKLKGDKEDLEKKLNDKTINLKEAGSIAEASLKLNKIFETAQEAANQYLSSIKAVNKSQDFQGDAQNTTEDKKHEAICEIEKTAIRQKDNYENETERSLTSYKPNYENEIEKSLIIYKPKLYKRVLMFFEKLLYASRTAILFLNMRMVMFIKLLGTTFKKLGSLILLIFKKTNKKGEKDHNSKKNSNVEISLECLEKELIRRKKARRKVIFMRSFFFASLVVIAIAIITATSLFRVLQVSGSSMEPNLRDNELLITSRFFGYGKGDMIAFYYNDMVLIKRVIATEGDTVYIEDDGTVYVNNNKLEESYAMELDYGKCNIKFPYIVPNDSVFVLGDNRRTSLDSRSVGCISKDNIIGKIKFKLSPFTVY
ncbi:MAG: signal peptidase I [Clostridia bacterium]|nr:signal peptidase I [Clostridia bacterium]